MARHGRLPRTGAGRGVLKLVGAGLAVVLVSSLCVAGVAVWNLTSQIKPGVALEGEENIPEIGAIEGGVNLLLVGSDSGEGNPAYGERGEHLADVTMLLHISEDHSNATVVSFPRDLLVPIPSCDGHSAMSAQKLNSSLSYGGLSCTVETVKDLTGLDIPFAAKIEFDGVIQMSNAVGGVPVCVASDIRDKQIGLYLTAGEHTLSGWDALQFVRTRYGVGDGSDLSRISNQQVFLSSLARTIKSAETLSDPVKVYGLAQAAVSNMEMSNSLQNVTTLASIALALKDIPLDNVNFVRYPGGTGTSGGLSVVIPNKSDASILFDAIAADQPITITGDTGDGSSVDPNAPVEEATPETPETPADPGATGEATAPDATQPPTPTSVELPSTIMGQSAGTYTCSAGQ
ncbi:LytR family transcriptional attenuator [Homoserinimonas aerilata]|uniref:LytR family transcriptional attenuator n=1 Tax=Homoserinimonas aerilata TaxID=1162970 RepID=A0A542YHZ3_9MICO|nr:LytR family transcriptional attenuator [Homoserinimonas aerilata]